MNAAIIFAGLLALVRDDVVLATENVMNPSSRVVCWCNTVKKEKTKSNNAAQSRIDELKAYIADVESGKVEFTTERADLELQQKELVAEIDKAKAIRESEAKDYEAAKKSMKEAISALRRATQVVSEGMSLVQESGPTLLSLRWDLRQALELGRAGLDAGDAQLLERVLDGEVKPKDWKKLNRKATFKAKYRSKSGGILDILEKLMKAKEGMLEHVKEALLDMSQEGAAKTMS